MNFLDFHKHYPDEESCKLAFKAHREKAGIICSRCQNTTHYWKKKREQWECKKCAHRTTLKSGTVMHNSKLSFQYWFIAMLFITSTKKSFSAKEVQKQLGHKRYEPIWAMMHKLRSVMGLRDDLYDLKEQVELDEGFFETVDMSRDYSKALKRGRGSEKQTTVLVSTESLDVEDKNKTLKPGKETKLRYIKMKVIDSLKKEVLKSEVDKTIEKGSVIKTDGSNSYNDLKTDYIHHPTVSTMTERSKLLPWAHTMISNAKRLLLDVHHRIDDDFLQNYLTQLDFFYPNFFISKNISKHNPMITSDIAFYRQYSK